MHPKHMPFDRSYSLNPMCTKFISNDSVFRKTEVRIFENFLYILCFRIISFLLAND